MTAITFWHFSPSRGHRDDPVDNSEAGLLGLGDPTSCVADHQPERGRTMAKRKKGIKSTKASKTPTYSRSQCPITQPLGAPEEDL